MTDTETPKPKKTRTPEQKAAAMSTRSVARALARMEGKATPAELKTRWEEKKKDYTAQAKKLVKALARESIELTVVPRPKKAKGEKAKGKESEAASEA